jgi:carboxypeptidase PM20D1
MVKRALIAFLALSCLLAAALAFNTWRAGSQQIEVAPLAPLAVDQAAAAQSLAAAVRARTISGLLDPAAQAREFDALQAHLKARYPLVHQRLALETVGGHSLVFTWQGSDAAARPIALLAHQDVVPVAPGTEALWQQPPFAGELQGGYVWGRGAWDDKSNLIAQLEAVETLLAAGVQPRRTVYLIFGHDEEVGGAQGAGRVAELFRQRGVRLDWVLDEGLLVTEGLVPGVQAPVALIGVAEKGILTLQLTAQAAPGHSSMPPAPGGSAIGMLSAALARLDREPVPGGIGGVARRMFEVLAPEMGGAQRVLLSNLWLFKPLAERMLARSPSTDALLRTTTAITIFNAGQRENVLPGRADAYVNFRLLPGDSIESVTAHVRRAVADERIEIKPTAVGSPPSRVSAADSEAFRLLARTVREVFPGALVAPGLMLAATDGRHFEAVADNVYRFSPVRAGAADLGRFHGTDERISIANLAEMIRFYHRLLQQTAL